MSSFQQSGHITNSESPNCTKHPCNDQTDEAITTGINRLRQHASLLKKVSPDTKLEVTKKDLGDFTKHVLATLQ
jgi:hypothetical protein